MLIKSSGAKPPKTHLIILAITYPKSSDAEELATLDNIESL